MAGTDPLAGHPKYRKIRDLGEGSYGFVQLARDMQANQDVAIKFWQRGPSTITIMVQREVQMHSCFVHQHIVQFREVFLTPQHLCLAMEYAPGGDLLSYLNENALKSSNTEDAARWFFQQLILAIDYCHRRNVINRDIKLENTLLTLPPVGGLPLIKLTDFGFCKNLMNSLARSQVGTPAYIAPEVVLCQTGYDGRAADLWSCGVMLYIMLFLKYPFQLSGTQQLNEQGLCPELMQKIIEMEYDIPYEPKVTDACKDLLRRLLCRADRRITVDEIRQHPWFRAGVMNVDDIWKYNEMCMLLDPHMHDNYQSMAEITKVLDQASMPLASDDQFIDAMADNVSPESSMTVHPPVGAIY